MCFYTELEQTVLNLWYVKAMGVRRGVKTGAKTGGAIAPPKTNELTLFAMIVYNSEKTVAIQGHFVIQCFVTDVL